MCEKGEILIARTEAISENEMEFIKQEIINLKQQLVFVKNTYEYMHKTVESLEENDFHWNNNSNSYNSNNYSNSNINNISNYIQFEKDDITSDSEQSFDHKDDFLTKDVCHRKIKGIGSKMSLLSVKNKRKEKRYQISQPGDLFIKRNMAFIRPTPSTSSIEQSSSSDSEYIYANLSSKCNVDSIENLTHIPIGLGNTRVPKAVFDEINWKSYTAATRKLLMAVFSRKVLATHSLTGKPSPAFADKPAKLGLNPLHVADIIYEVSEKCNVKPNLVRIAITTKCADENKMMKMKIMKRNAI